MKGKHFYTPFTTHTLQYRMRLLQVMWYFTWWKTEFPQTNPLFTISMWSFAEWNWLDQAALHVLH